MFLPLPSAQSKGTFLPPLEVLTAVDYIGYNCTFVWEHVCTLAVEYYIACAVASYHNAVELIVNVSKLALVRNEHRSNDNVKSCRPQDAL